jgi:hypothetical protein
VRRARLVALVAVPVLLLGAGCRGGDAGGAGGADTGSDSGAVTGPATGAPEESGGVEQDFADIESTLDSIEAEIARDGR